MGSVGVRTIKLMADYFCWPLWEASPGQIGNINPNELPISADLKDRLRLWAADYDATLMMDDPARSGFNTVDAKAAFIADSLRISADLKKELGPAFHIFLYAID
jgi:hypothetical protein